jgi:hypothetical protein
MFFEYLSALRIAERFIDRMDLNAAKELAKSISSALDFLCNAFMRNHE